MNNTIIRNWNERVKPEDIVYHNGDFCFRNSKGGKPGEGVQIKAVEWERQLNGKIIHCAGNHDNNNSTKTLIERMVIKYGNTLVHMVHDPANVDFNYEINFVGHIHDKWKIMRIEGPNKTYTDAINIGTDVWNFRPVSFEEIMKIYNGWLKERGYR